MACPFMTTAAADAGLNPAADISKFPMHQQILEAHQRAGHIPAQGQSQGQTAAVCPLGFGSAGGPKLTKLHCPICKGLLFDAHTTASCKHTFCHTCISRTADCPICGMDVDGTEPNTELSSLVETFLSTHSQSPQLVAAQADLGPLPDDSAASFFMAQGLKSLAGGNIHAALHRLSRCRDALLAEMGAGDDAAGAAAAAGGETVNKPIPGNSPAADSNAGAAALETVTSDNSTAGAAAPVAAVAAAADSGTHPAVTDLYPSPQQAGAAGTAPPPPAAVIMKACQMATVCGLLADCSQRLGDSAQAEQWYSESMSSVVQYSEQDAEAAHAMSVSLNKLGDMRYSQQLLPVAKQLYKQALELRQMACGPLTSGQAGPEQQLELASSLIKVADVTRALGDPEEAERLLRRAAGVCFEVKLQEADLPASTSRKMQLLLDVLHSRALRQHADSARQQQRVPTQPPAAAHADSAAQLLIQHLALDSMT